MIPARLASIWDAVTSRPTRTTIHRPTVERTGPAPSAYRRHGERSWLVPPLEVDGPEVIEVGDDVVIMEHLSMAAVPGGRIVIGDRVRLGRFVTLRAATSIVIGDDVSSSDLSSITDTWGPLVPLAGRVPPPPPAAVTIEDGAYLGAGCIIGPGVTVGRGAFVGEGSVVLEDVPAHSVVYGNPARVVRHHVDGVWTGSRFG